MTADDVARVTYIAALPILNSSMKVGYVLAKKRGLKNPTLYAPKYLLAAAMITHFPVGLSIKTSLPASIN
jgi:hypothetical protein